MKQASIRFDRQYVVGEIDPRVGGAFVEHLGRCVYGGLYEPTHPTADALGFRGDVKALIRELGVTCLRYPGGNFVSGYRWQDGIGPRASRPARRELAWNTVETNEVGTDEFAALCRELGIELILACNLGTGTPQDAGDLADYCTGGGDTRLSALRVQNGYPEPYLVPLWCMGNEMDGMWQINMLNASDYANKAREAAKIVKWTVPSAGIIACGSCTNELGHTSFGDWDRTVLETAYDQIDYLSLHRYYNYHPDRQLFYPANENESDIPYFFDDLAGYIDTVTSACDFVRGKLRREKRINISFDEWGLVAQSRAVTDDGACKAASFTTLDAVIYGGMICTLLNRADRVKVACQSLLINEGGMITTVPGGAAFRQSVFYPFRDMARCAHGVSLCATGNAPAKETDHHGKRETLIYNASYDEEARRVTLLVANCDLTDDCEVTVRLTDFGALRDPRRTELYTDDPYERNVPEASERVIPHDAPAPTLHGDALSFTARKHSWNVVTVSLA